MDYLYGWKPYVSVVARRAQAARQATRLQKAGRTLAPVWIDGRKIATTFWGKAWCENLERYSDFANRLPRGRTYVRNGSVIDLQIAGGAVTALVSGSDMYTVRIGVAAVPGARWKGICRDCTGAIDSLIELLQGRLSTAVITRICEPKTGLFPEPKELSFSCSCPDWASMCKHVAAVLYGVGARFDERPDLLFLLRGVDQEDLIAKAGTALPSSAGAGRPGKVIESGDLSQIFDIEIAAAETPARAVPRRGRPGAASTAAAKYAVPPAAKKVDTAGRRAKKVEAAGRAAMPASREVAKPGRVAKPGVRSWTAADRAAVAARMKKYWAERRAAAERRRKARAAAAATPVVRPDKKATPAARPARPRRGAAEHAQPGSAAWRKAVSERMKKYWAEQRRRRAAKRAR